MSKWNLGNATLVILNEILFTARVLATLRFMKFLMTHK